MKHTKKNRMILALVASVSCVIFSVTFLCGCGQSYDVWSFSNENDDEVNEETSDNHLLALMANGRFYSDGIDTIEDQESQSFNLFEPSLKEKQCDEDINDNDDNVVNEQEPKAQKNNNAQAQTNVNVTLSDKPATNNNVSDNNSYKYLKSAISSTRSEREPMTITIKNANGSFTMPYIDAIEWPSAPETGAGLWNGSDSVTDGTHGYFIGHNPGDFTCVVDLKINDEITVCDRNGKFRSYHVKEIEDVGRDNDWGLPQKMLMPLDEAIGLQTCLPNDMYRIVIAN